MQKKIWNVSSRQFWKLQIFPIAVDHRKQKKKFTEKGVCRIELLGLRFLNYLVTVVEQADRPKPDDWINKHKTED